MNDVERRLGERVRAERERLGLSQTELGRLAGGLHRTYIGGVERGERNISLRNLVRIAAALGVTVGYLVDDDQV